MARPDLRTDNRCQARTTAPSAPMDRRLRQRREDDRPVAHGPTIDAVTEWSRHFGGRDVTASHLSGGHVNRAYAHLRLTTELAGLPIKA
jgi:hypothetical protein